ncbi:uncharacterized protein [Drosophila kikkawai]|uniref:Uncharacterized protein n=1 Tax=Drosophila kikkawai TaxID=30033 RepID=A0A6P4I288_DROKI|nr:uncharacterized protein LOC108074635 [Drosophila kikkawai]
MHSILTANSNGNTPTHTQKDIQPCETVSDRFETYQLDLTPRIS